VALLPGLDGRKMSKSYDNTIALFAPREDLRKKIMGIVTDSRLPGEPKETEGSALFQIYQAFADADETAMLAQAFAEGVAWSDAKQMLFERIDREIAPMRDRYAELMAAPAEVERILRSGAEKARTESAPYMRQLREAAGLRNLAVSAGATQPQAAGKTALPAFRQYREKDGLFYFKLAAPGGAVLLQSRGYANPREAAAAIALCKEQGKAALASLQDQLQLLAQPAVVEDWLQQLQAAD
jgi:tryptophanyl-tRNA synthetase